MLVVLILMGLAAALVLPLLEPRHQDEAPELASLVRRARGVAVREGRVVNLHVEPSGRWQVIRETGGAVVLSGAMQGAMRSSLILVLSPTGSCAPAADSPPLERTARLDPLVCELRFP